MIKVLLRKQILEIAVPFTVDRKTGKRKTKSQMIPYILLYVYLIGLMGFNAVNNARNLIVLFAGTDLEWMYFSLMCLLSMSLGVILSIFMAYSSIFMARDNDFLLSLPIKPGDIVVSRTMSAFLWAFMFSFEGIIASAVLYFIYCGFSLKVLIGALVFLALIPVFGGAVGSLVAWIIGQLTKKIAKKNAVITVFLMVFVGGYSALNSMLMSSVTAMTSVTQMTSREYAMANVVKLFGKGLGGDFVSLLLSVLITAVLYGLVLLLLNRSFIGIITTKVSGKKKQFKGEMITASSPTKALLRREFRHFFSSAVYLSNTAMGSFFMILGAIALAIFGGRLKPLLNAIPFVSENLSIIALGVVMLLCSTNDVAAPSYSLEGRTLWILKSLPIDIEEVLAAKLNLHLIVTMVPALMLCGVLLVVFEVDAMVFLAALFYTATVSGIELLMDLKWGCTTYTNEVVAVKQNVTVMGAFGMNLLVVTVTIGPFFLLRNIISSARYMEIIFVVLVAGSLLVRKAVSTTGVKLFEREN